jgi:hypothetical protein
MIVSCKNTSVCFTMSLSPHSAEQIFMKFCMRSFTKIWQHIPVLVKIRQQITGTLLEDLHTFLHLEVIGWVIPSQTCNMLELLFYTVVLPSTRTSPESSLSCLKFCGHFLFFWTNQPTLWTRVLLEKLIVAHEVKKFSCHLWNLKVNYRVHKSPASFIHAWFFYLFVFKSSRWIQIMMLLV